MIRFVARRSFIWEGRRLEVGDKVEIEERHPRLEAMFLGRYIAYDSAQDVPAGLGSLPISQPVAKPRRARTERLATA